ncbi:MAG: hypothetical protein RR075_00665 [Pygmaiobacter sp.]
MINTMKKSIGKRILAALLGLLIVLGLLLAISTVTGNPLIQALAKSKATAYLKATYPDDNCVLESIRQITPGSFGYEMEVGSPGNVDLHFTLSVSKTGDVTDTYDYWVESGRATQRRLSAELAAAASAVLEEELPSLFIKSCDAVYGYDASGVETFPDIAFASAFTAGMPFDQNAISVPTLLHLVIGADKPSDEALHKLLSQLKATLEQKGLPFDYYTLTLELPEASYDFSALQSEARSQVVALASTEIDNL